MTFAINARLKSIVRSSFTAAILAVAFSLPGTAFADTQATYVTLLTSASTGTPLHAWAEFTILSSTKLRVDFADLSSRTGQENRADLLSTILFNFAPSVTVNTANGASNVTTKLLGTSTVRRTNGTVATSQAVNGSWVFGKQIDGDAVYKYGLSGSGFGNTNTNGTVNSTANGVVAYQFSGFTLGNGSDDYLLLRKNASTMNGSATNVIRNGVRMEVTGFSGLTDISQITKVGFGFASGAFTNIGYVVGTGVQAELPEPRSNALCLFGLFAASVLVRTRLKRTKR